MKIHEYREMMKYLTRPDVSKIEIPTPVPQAPVEPQGLSDEEHAAILNERAQAKQNYATGGRVGYAEGSVAKSTKNKLIDDFLKEELKNNKGKITNQSSADLAEKFNNKYPDKEFYFNGELSPVDHKSIHYRISNNPEFKKNIPLIIGRRIDPVYEDKINKALDVYKKLSDEEKRALRTGGVGHTGALDKFMEDNDLFRESSKYGNKMDQKGLDKNLFSRKLKESGIERPEALSLEENSKNQKLRRKEILNEISSTGYEKHIEDFKRNLQEHLGIEKSELSTGRKMFPLDLAHRTDIDQLYALGQKMDPSDLGVDYYKTNREGYKSMEAKLSDLYDEQNKLYKQAKKLDKVPEPLSKKIFLNNDEILQTIGESPFKDKLKPITINPITLEVKRGSVITDDVTKQLGMGLVETPMNKMKIGSEEDAIIKLNLAQQVVDEANQLGLIKNVDASRKAANEFVVGKPLSTTASNMLSSFPAQFGESALVGNLSKAAKGYWNLTGGIYNPIGGAVFNSEEMQKKGLDEKESAYFGGVKAIFEDSPNFAIGVTKAIGNKILPAPVRQLISDGEEKGFFDTALNDKTVDISNVPYIGSDWYAKQKSDKEKIDNHLNYALRKELAKQNIASNPYGVMSDLGTVEGAQENYATPEQKDRTLNNARQILLRDEDIRKKYEAEKPTSTTGVEFKIGGRVGYANGSDDDLEIPTLSNQETPMSGIYNSKRLGPEDAISRYQPYSELELLGNISAKKPNYQIEEEYMQNEMPIYEPRDTIPKGSRPVMPNAYDNGPNDGIISLATGGRASFQTGGSANFLKMLRNISDSVRELKNSTHMLGYTARSSGITKAAEEALTPYAGGFKGNKHETLIQKIETAKEHLPKEYHGVLDEMKAYADKHAYDAVDDMAKALDKTIDPNLKFENLSKKMFPMEDPLNDAFIIIDPEKGHSVGRYVQRHTVDQETGRGIIQTMDTWDPVNRKFLPEGEQKLIGVESIEKGKEGLN